MHLNLENIDIHRKLGDLENDCEGSAEPIQEPAVDAQSRSNKLVAALAAAPAKKQGPAAIRRSSTGLMQAKGSLQLARQYHMAPEEVEEVQRLFNEADTRGAGLLHVDAFPKLIKTIKGTLYGSKEVILDAIEGEYFSLEDILQWLLNHAFDQDVLVPSERRRLRELALQWGTPSNEVEELYQEFVWYADEQTGMLDFQGFQHLLCSLCGVSGVHDVSEKRTDSFWKEIDKNRLGTVTFEELFCWYRKGAMQRNRGFMRSSSQIFDYIAPKQ